MSNGERAAIETNIFCKILRLLLYAALLTPIWVWSGFLFPFITSKVIYLRIVLEAALAIYIVLALKYPEIRPRWNWLTKAVWIYLAIVLAASIFGVNFYKSFWGTIERGEGIVTLLHYAAFFTMLPGVFRTDRDWKKYLWAAFIMIMFVGLVGAAQLGCPEGYNSPGALCRHLPPSQGIRISSTIGNASFFSAFMVFGVFLSAYLFSETQKKWLKWLLGAAALFAVFIIVQTQTRGGAIALYVGAFLYLLFYLLRGSDKTRRLFSAIMLLLMIAAPVVLFTKQSWLPGFVRETPIVRRLSTISRGDVTTQSRLDTWNAAAQGWKDRFWTGWGYENFNLAFNKYFPPAIFRDAGSQVWFDRAHNIVFDIAATSGVFGLASYLAIFLAAAAALYRLVRAGALSWQKAAILIAALAAYLVQNAFVFDTHATYLLFFLVLAFIVHLKSSFEGAAESAVAAAKKIEWGYAPPVVLTLAAIAGIYFVNLKPAAANYFTTQAIKAAKLQQYRGIQANFEKALSYGTYMDEEIRQRVVDYANEASASGLLSPQERKQLYEFVSGQLDKNIVQAPADVKNYLYQMSVLNIASNLLDHSRVFSLGQKALELSPARMQIYTELGQAAFLQNRHEEGLEYFRQAIALNPYPKESHFNYILGSILAGREDLAESELAAVASLGHALNANDYGAMARAYTQVNNLPKALENYNMAITLQPGNITWYVRIAAVYGEACDVAGARAAVSEAVKLDARYQADGQAFISSLEQKCQ